MNILLFSHAMHGFCEARLCYNTNTPSNIHDQIDAAKQAHLKLIKNNEDLRTEASRRALEDSQMRIEALYKKMKQGSVAPSVSASRPLASSPRSIPYNPKAASEQFIVQFPTAQEPLDLSSLKTSFPSISGDSFPMFQPDPYERVTQQDIQKIAQEVSAFNAEQTIEELERVDPKNGWRMRILQQHALNLLAGGKNAKDRVVLDGTINASAIRQDEGKILRDLGFSYSGALNQQLIKKLQESSEPLELLSLEKLKELKFKDGDKTLGSLLDKGKTIDESSIEYDQSNRELSFTLSGGMETTVFTFVIPEKYQNITLDFLKNIIS